MWFKNKKSVIAIDDFNADKIKSEMPKNIKRRVDFKSGLVISKIKDLIKHESVLGKTRIYSRRSEFCDTKYIVDLINDDVSEITQGVKMQVKEYFKSRGFEVKIEGDYHIVNCIDITWG